METPSAKSAVLLLQRLLRRLGKCGISRLPGCLPWAKNARFHGYRLDTWLDTAPSKQEEIPATAVCTRVPWERAGPSASTAGESSPPYPWGQSDSSVARTRRHPQALRFSVVTGLVTNTVMHPCGNLGVVGVTPIEFMDTCMDTSLARVRVLF